MLLVLLLFLSISCGIIKHYKWDPSGSFKYNKWFPSGLCFWDEADGGYYTKYTDKVDTDGYIERLFACDDAACTQSCGRWEVTEGENWLNTHRMTRETEGYPTQVSLTPANHKIHIYYAKGVRSCADPGDITHYIEHDDNFDSYCTGVMLNLAGACGDEIGGAERQTIHFCPGMEIVVPGDDSLHGNPHETTSGGGSSVGAAIGAALGISLGICCFLILVAALVIAIIAVYLYMKRKGGDNEQQPKDWDMANEDNFVK